jgi:hypothetical protein
MISVAQGQEVLIRGTVTDTSAGAKNLVAKSLFSAVPAVSDASQDDWMNHLYMQKALPNNVEGVKVRVTAIDPNGNYQDIGTATTDINGKYGLAWTPPVPGTYHVTATFESTNSYWGSTDTTYFVVGKATAAPQVKPTESPISTATPAVIQTPTQAPSPTAASPSPSQAPPPAVATSTTTYIALSAIVIVVVLAAAVLIFRKRK